jgi:hypothetical protein
VLEQEADAVDLDGLTAIGRDRGGHAVSMRERFARAP